MLLFLTLYSLKKQEKTKKLYEQHHSFNTLINQHIRVISEDHDAEYAALASQK